jgi:asparagine synthase (glutamine-hydrolysing)
MCGIVAMVQLDGTPVDLPLLAHMAAALDHRGPDDEGHVVDGTVGLYHKRLSIIDLKTGQQPMTRHRTTVTFNGEIYNYVELRDALKRRGRPFQTTSDTEVILAMYEEYGADCIPALNGMFAFVLYDRYRRRLIAARDHFGIKPLYYRADGRRVVFASEIKALLRHPDVTSSPDRDAMRDYITFQFVLGEATLFAGIRKVQPGHYIELDVDSGALRTVRYWEPRFQVDPDHTETYFVSEVRRLLEDTASIQMRSDVPVGTYLSGGMDSSIVTRLAANRSPGGLKSFTGVFREGPEFDESRYAQEVAEACAADLRQVVPTEDDFVDLLPHLVYHMDEPVAGPGLLPQYVVARAAAREVKVVLGGQGGDEIFGGYARYVVAYLEQALKGAIFETNEEREHIVSLASIIPNLPHLQSYVPMLCQFWRSGVFESMDERYYRLVDRSAGSLSLFSEDFRALYDQREIFARFQGVFNHPDTLSYFNKMTHFDLVASLPALLHVEDRVTMAASLESRVPLLDRRLAELVASVPPVMKFRGGELKYVLKRAARDLLPQSVYERKDKMGFPVPLHLWMRGRGGEFVRDTLLSSTCFTRGLFDRDAIERLTLEDKPFDRRLWGILNLELWHRAFVDNSHHEPEPVCLPSVALPTSAISTITTGA